MITVEIWILMIIIGMGTLFAGLFLFKNRDAAISYFFSILFLFVAAVASPHIEYITSNGIQSANNSLIGIILIPIALIATGLAIKELTSEAVEQAGV